jgi:hypothetical protein
LRSTLSSRSGECSNFHDFDQTGLREFGRENDAIAPS